MNVRPRLGRRLWPGASDSRAEFPIGGETNRRLFRWNRIEPDLQRAGKRSSRTLPASTLLATKDWMIIRNGRTWAASAPRALFVFFALVLITAPLPLVAAAGASPSQDPELAANPIYTWLQDHKTAAYWAAPMLMVLVAILPIPAEIPAAMNGMLFGTILGVLMTWAGAMIGAMISYELARCFGRKLSRRFVKQEVVDRLESLKNTEAPVLLMLRLTPVVAFTVVNWASGLLQVQRSTFVWTTAVGILPGAIVFTASGSAAASLFQRYPIAVPVVVVAVCGALLIRIWWKHRFVPSL